MKKLILLTLLFTTNYSFSQKYEKTYRQDINYNTGTKNGKDVNLDFACKYDVFIGEPIFKSRTKVVSEGDFVMYNGKKYYRNEIGNEIFDKIEIGLINVSFDIYQGNRKITTVSLYNEISVSFIAGSPDWDEMWPGVSEERVKKIWKEGYSIRNAKLYDVKFSGFYALKSYLNKKEVEKKKQLEVEQRKKEETEKKAKEEEETEEENSNTNDKTEVETEEEKRRREAKQKQLKEEQKLKQKQEAEERERKRKEEAERKRKEKIKAYNDRIESQRKENNAIAASAAASSASVLYLIGGIIYDKMGLPAKDLYTGNNFHVNFDIGYGFSVFPIANNSVKTGIDFNGNNTETTNNDPSTALTIDLRLALKFGYEMEYGGGNIYGRFEPGFSPIFTDFNTSYGYGAEIFGGHKNIKLYGRYESGNHSFSSSNWIDPEEIGEGGKSSTKYQQIRAGLKFSYYRNHRTAKRDHLIIGIMENYFDENSASIFGIRENPDKPILNLLSTPSEADLNPYIATGYFFEWKRDHTHRLYIEIFPNYPVTGKIGGRSSEGNFFMQVGFSRSIEGFFGKK